MLNFAFFQKHFGRVELCQLCLIFIIRFEHFCQWIKLDRIVIRKISSVKTFCFCWSISELLISWQNQVPPPPNRKSRFDTSVLAVEVVSFSFGQTWLDLVTFCQIDIFDLCCLGWQGRSSVNVGFRLLLVFFGRIWSDLVIFNRVWSYLIRYSRSFLVSFSHIRSFSIISDLNSFWLLLLSI